MKLSELSYREYIALEIVGHLAGTMLDKEAAWRAFTLADEFLKRAGKYRDLAAEAARASAMAEALELIASCEVRAPGDVVDIARKALGK